VEIHTPGLDSICYSQSSSQCFRSDCYRSPMNLEAEANYRKERLRALSVRLGGLASLGRFLGYKDGAYIGQMLRGDRPITEKLIAEIEAKPGLKGWFTATKGADLEPAQNVAQLTYSSAQQAREPLESVAEHVVQIGNALLQVDEVRRNAIAELLAGVARQPNQARSIASHITALLHSSGKIAA